MVARTTDEGAGFLKRRALRIQAAGIRAVGPTDLHPPPPPEPTPASRIRTQRADTAQLRAHREMVGAELRAVDDHERDLRRRTGRRRPTLFGRAASSYREQEVAAELRALAELRRELEADLEHPVRNDRYGRPLDDRMRRILTARTTELREQMWRAGQRAEAEGDHRRARQCRHDALRARHVAEYEAGLRPQLRGYSFPG